MMNNNDGNGDLDINMDSDSNSKNIEGDSTQQKGNFGVGDNKGKIDATNVAGTIIINNHPSEKTFKPIKYIPKIGSANFVGRKNDLEKVHEKLQGKNNRVAISAVSGMGGVGKTELAIQYANQYENDYPGGICWFNARSGDIAAQIIGFAFNLNLPVPQKDFQDKPLGILEQVKWCWLNWQPPKKLVLVVLDDVTDVEDFSELLPPNDRFRVLITTRLRDWTLDKKREVSGYLSLTHSPINQSRAEKLSELRG